MSLRFWQMVELSTPRGYNTDMKCRHTKQPQGYLAWHEWADKKSKKHFQVKCPACGLLKVWKRKPTNVSDHP